MAKKHSAKANQKTTRQPAAKPAKKVAGKPKARTAKNLKPTNAKAGNSEMVGLKSSLQALLEKPKTQKKIIALLKPLNEKQRRDLAPGVLTWFNKQKKNSLIERPKGNFRRNPLLEPTETALFCVGSFSDIKKISRWRLPDGQDMVDILKARNPKWTGDLASTLLHTTNYWNSWRTVRELVRNKLCKKPDDVRYYTGMISGLGGYRFENKRRTAYDGLKADPELLKDEVWRLFEYEGEGENTLANVDHFEKVDWSGALVKLSKSGKLPRAKLLKSALSALELGFNHYRSKWFFDFFDAMKPNEKELKQFSPEIFNLVASPTPNVAQWAFDKLQKLVESGAIKDSGKIFEAVSPLLTAKQKGTVLSTLKLFGKLIASSDQRTDDVCVMAAKALGHEKSDVQKAAFKFISAHSKPGSKPVRSEVERYAPVVAASLRKQIVAWLESDEAVCDSKPISKTTKSPGPKAKSASKRTKFDRKKLAKLPKPYLTLAKIDELIESFESSEQLASLSVPAARFDGTEIPRLIPNRRLKPIADLNELIEVCGRVIEDSSLIDEGERALDGIARLGRQKPDDFDAMIAPIHKRARKLLQRGKSAFGGQGLNSDLCGLICVWVSGQTVSLKHTKSEHGSPQIEITGVEKDPYTTWYEAGSPIMFLSQRSLAIAKRLSNGPIVLLSAPTHVGGWIDPKTFVTRANQLKSPPEETDLILALLRLAPQKRAAALKEFKPKCSGEWTGAVKFALGGNVTKIGKLASIWVAAARARSPFEDAPKIAKAFPKLGPGCGNAARYKVRHFQEKRGRYTYRRVAIETTEKLPKKRQTMLPTQLLQIDRDDSSFSFQDFGTDGGSIQWLSKMWPLALDSFFAAGSQALADNLDWWEAAWHNRCFMEPLLDPDVPPREIGIFMLLCGLAAKEPGEHGLAADIAIQAIADGRIGTDNLHEVIAKHVTQDTFNLPRLAKRFTDIASMSAAHAYVVMRAWELALPKFEELPRGFGDIIELMCELGAQLDRGVCDQACTAFLETIKGSNKTAKTAKALLALETTFDARNAVEELLNQRVERVKRWHQSKS